MKRLCLLPLLLICFVLVAAPVHQGTRYYPVLGGMERIQWLLQNEMNSITGEVGTWLERDVESKIAFTSGWAEFTPQATAAYAEQDIVCSTIITRAAGVGILGKFRCTTDGSFYPLALVTSTTPTWGATHVEAAFHRAATALSLTATYNATAGPIIATFVADGTEYKLALIADGTAGYKYLIKGGAFANWTLLFRSATGNTASLYAAMAGYDAAFGADFCRGPLSAIPLNNPLLLDTFSGTFGTPDTYGNPWLHAGTWATAGGVASNTPVAGAELCTSLVNGTSYPFETFTAVGRDITSAINTTGFGTGLSPTFATIVGQWFKISLDSIIINSGASPWLVLANGEAGSAQIAITSPATQQLKTGKILTAHASASLQMSVGNGIATDFAAAGLSCKPLPISTLIASQFLVTTDVLAEAVLTAYTLGTQAGIVQSDRPFAFPANANAASGQNVIVLKNLTNAIPDSDSITIKHPITPTTYTIASVSALVGGVQTLTLDSNLVEAVSADDMVGVNWASWNGTLTYFDGGGNIKLDEIKAGVYTNRGSTAKAFSANARFIVRKIGSEYRIFYGESLIGTAITTVDAAAMVGTYWGMFSTDASNTFNSIRADDTGNVTNSNSILDKDSQDTSSLMLPKEYCPDTYWREEVGNG